jgi:outer membrane protein
MRHALFASVLALSTTVVAGATAPAAAQQQITSVTLRQAIKLAEQVSPSVVSASGALQSSALSVRQARLAYLPDLSIQPSSRLDLSSGQSRVNPVTGEIISGNSSNIAYSLGVSASYTLFDGFQRAHNVTAAKASEHAADVGLVSARFANVQTTTSAFLAALSDQQLVAAQQANVTLAERQFRVAVARVNGGSGSVSDSLSARVLLNQARVGLLQAQTRLAADEAALGRLVGVSGRVRANDDSSLYLPAAPLDTAALMQDALASAPDIQSAQAEVTRSHAQYEADKSPYWPTLAASASTAWSSQKIDDYRWIPRRGLSVYLSFNPWTNLQRETQVEQAQIQETTAEAQLADTRRRVVSQLEQQFAQAAVAELELQLDSTSVAAARLNVDVLSSRYALGSGSIIDLLQAQRDLNTAQTDQINARYSYLQAVAAIQAILGRTLLDRTLQPGP